MPFENKRILLGVSGCIAAYKGAELARRLAALGAQVKVVMTRSATEFVAPLTFGALTGQPVSGSLWGEKVNPLEHIFLGQQVDAIVIAPATANIIGKLAGGIGDDLLTTIMLAATRPVLVCPAMNCEMWANPAVQENVARLAARGFEIMPPDAGELACGALGFGRLAGPRGHRGGPGPAGLPAGPGGAAGPGHRRSHPRGPGPGAFFDQPQQRQDGLRPGQGGLAPGRRGLPGERPHGAARPLWG
jgi:3-polyprenyl-4-hydroxybenzoate decarboxylase